MYDVVFKSAEKEFRMFVLKKAPQGMIHLKKKLKALFRFHNLLPNLDMKFSFRSLYIPYSPYYNSK